MRPRLPAWFRQALPPAEAGGRVKRLLERLDLHAVCEGARCPNRATCWHEGTAAFLILGAACTRNCRFCAIPHDPRPAPPDPAEPARVARAAAEMGLRHVVVTSVTRDDLPDGGAAHFAAAIHAIRARLPAATVEVLIPDFRADPEALRLIMAERPEILNHNVETVARLYRCVQPQDHHEWSQYVLTSAKQLHPEGLTKSGIMVGLGESWEELEETMRELRSWKVDILTIGQYLQPSRKHLGVKEYISLEQFRKYREIGLEKGFRFVESGPLVRSSYRAERHI